MPRFRVSRDFTKSQGWTARDAARYGADNQGFTIEADSVEHAKDILRKEHQINPFYLKIEEV